MSCKEENKACVLPINVYKIYDILDDGVYVAKSKNDVLEDVGRYGDVLEVYGVDPSTLLEVMREITLCSKEAQAEREWADDKVKCIYDLYKEVAEADQGTQMILCYNI